MAVNRYDGSRAWYAVSTYSGYEDKVADSIRQRLDSLEFSDIFDVIVPKEKQIEIKNGKRRISDKKIFQGYVLVEMKLSDATWYIIRNTPGVTGFVPAGSSQPTPVSKKEIEKIKKRMGVEDPKFTVNYAAGEVVSVIDGPFKGFEGTISEIDTNKGKLKVLVSMFGRETAVELDALQVKKIDD